MMKKLVICGPGGSGKDVLMKRLIGSGYIGCVSYTTRPIRNGEVNHRDYHFITEEEFLELVSKDFFIEYKCFNDWYYGISHSEINYSEVVILTPLSLNSIDRSKCFIVYLDIPEDVRRTRLSKRKDADDVERRLTADREMFKNFTDFDLKITNPDF